MGTSEKKQYRSSSENNSSNDNSSDEEQEKKKKLIARGREKGREKEKEKDRDRDRDRDREKRKKMRLERDGEIMKEEICKDDKDQDKDQMKERRKNDETKRKKREESSCNGSKKKKKKKRTNHGEEYDKERNNDELNNDKLNDELNNDELNNDARNNYYVNHSNDALANGSSGSECNSYENKEYEMLIDEKAHKGKKRNDRDRSTNGQSDASSTLVRTKRNNRESSERLKKKKKKRDRSSEYKIKGSYADVEIRMRSKHRYRSLERKMNEKRKERRVERREERRSSSGVGYSSSDGKSNSNGSTASSTNEHRIDGITRGRVRSRSRGRSGDRVRSRSRGRSGDRVRSRSRGRSGDRVRSRSRGRSGDRVRSRSRGKSEERRKRKRRRGRSSTERTSRRHRYHRSSSERRSSERRHSSRSRRRRRRRVSGVIEVRRRHDEEKNKNYKFDSPPDSADDEGDKKSSRNNFSSGTKNNVSLFSNSVGGDAILNNTNIVTASNDISVSQASNSNNNIENLIQTLNSNIMNNCTTSSPCSILSTINSNLSTNTLLSDATTTLASNLLLDSSRNKLLDEKGLLLNQSKLNILLNSQLKLNNQSLQQLYKSALNLNDLCLSSLDATAEKTARELYVGNIPQHIDVQQIVKFLNTCLLILYNKENDNENICLKACIRGDTHYAFVEFRNLQDTSNCMLLNGINFYGNNLRIGRPKTFPTELTNLIPPATIPVIDNYYLSQGLLGLKAFSIINQNEGKVKNDYHLPMNMINLQKLCASNISKSNETSKIKELLEAFGEIKNLEFFEGEEFSDTYICLVEYTSAENAIQAHKILNQNTSYKIQFEYEILNDPVINKLVKKKYLKSENSILSQQIPTKAVVLNKIATFDELSDTSEYKDIKEDIKIECEKYGTVVEIVLPVFSRDTYDYLLRVKRSHGGSEAVEKQKEAEDEKHKVDVADSADSADMTDVAVNFKRKGEAPPVCMGEGKMENPNGDGHSIVEDSTKENQGDLPNDDLTHPNYDLTSIGCAFIYFENIESATKARKELSGRKFGANIIEANYYSEKKFLMKNFKNVKYNFKKSHSSLFNVNLKLGNYSYSDCSEDD
ncbi:RNA-binding protein, putative [Plasmodium malariae]|uniref:RNA-binding protein, putative n=1 Tax=Plasmodium malariae TaxID=5858 RepID=A0A1D3JIJ9_PLAMA|nr:RNA-binding protein, putative [Plasmodium malariae]SBT86269.1 RNA-binding protein, putative [Plasmodium malariae]